MTTIKWHIIKSNEDLPRAGKYVLVTNISVRRRVYIDTPMRWYDCPGWREGKRSPHKDWQDTYSGRIIAWAELPEPYQGKLK